MRVKIAAHLGKRREKDDTGSFELIWNTISRTSRISRRYSRRETSHYSFESVGIFAYVEAEIGVDSESCLPALNVTRRRWYSACGCGPCKKELEG